MTTIRYPKPKQLDALELDDHGIITASAGTGKTYLIERLVVELLLEGPADLRIEDILVVTFTRRATSELRQRLRAVLRDIIACVDAQRSPDALEEAEAHWTIGDEEARTLREAIYQFDRAPIYTIHAFCQRILSEYAFENRRLFDEEHVESGQLFERCFQELLRTTLAADPELSRYLEAWLAVDKSIDDLQEELYALQTSREELAPRMDPEAIEQHLDNARSGRLDGGDEASDRVETAVLQRFRPVVEEAIRDFKQAEGVYVYEDMLELVWESLEGTGDIGNSQAAELLESIRDRFRYGLIDEFQDTDPLQWKIMRRIFYESGGRNIIYLIGDPKQAIYGFRGADVDAYFEAVELVAGGDQPLMLRENYRSTESLVEAYNVIFDQSASSPFFDQPDITYDHPVTCGQPDLFLEDESGEAQPAVEILRLTASSDATIGIDDMRRTLRESMADEIARIVEGDTSLYVPNEEGTEARIQPSDIFVLTHTQRRGEEFGEALRARGIRHAFYRKSGLFETDEARHVLKVMRAISRPDDRSHRFHAYHTPFFEGDLDQLEALDALEGPEAPSRLLRRWHGMAQRREFERLFEDILETSGILRRSVFRHEDDRALTNYRHIFELLTQKSHRSESDFEELLDRLHSYLEGEIDLENQDDTLQRLESEEESVQIMTIHKSKGLEAELVFLYGGLGRSKKAGRTYKKSDGMKVRFLKRRMMNDDQKKEADRYYSHTSQRLMYVTITRARSRVYLPYMPPSLGDTERWKKITGRYRPVVERLDDIIGGIEEGAYPSSHFNVRRLPIRSHSTSSDADSDHRALETWSIPEMPSIETHSEGWFGHHRIDRTLRLTSFSKMHASSSPSTRIAGEDEASDSGEDDIFEDDDWVTDVPGPPPGRRTGSMLHECLERLDYGGVVDTSCETWRERPEVRSILLETMRDYGVGLTHRRACEEMIYRALTTRIIDAPSGTQLGCIAEVDRHRCEVEFHYPLPEPDHPRWNEPHAPDLEIEEGFVTGEIDLLVEEDGRIYFADWKSNLLSSYAPEHVAADVRDHYKLQTAIYTIAVVKMLGIRTRESYQRFGGWFYLYLRGLAPDKPGRGVVYDRPDWATVGEYWSHLEDHG